MALAACARYLSPNSMNAVVPRIQKGAGTAALLYIVRCIETKPDFLVQPVTIEQLVTDYGYPALLAGTFLEGETILIVAGFAAHQGYLKLWLVIVTAFAGSLAGDQLYFFLGRRKGRPFLEKRALWQAKATKVSRLIDRHGTWIILAMRFMYGFRTVTPFVIGASRFNTHRFLAFNAAGALIWAITISCIGFLCGTVAESALRHVRKVEGHIILLMLGLGAFIWLIYFVRRLIQIRKQHSADKESP